MSFARYHRYHYPKTIRLIKKSIMRATTDSDGEVRFDVENKPGISNLLSIYSVFSGKSIEQLEKDYAGSGYGNFKKDLVEVVVDSLAPIQQKYNDVMASGELDNILKNGAERANVIAEKTLKRVKESFGLGL